MQKRMNKYGALVFAGVLALSGCSGDDGKNGVDGTDGMSAVNGGKLSLVIDGVATTADASTVTFTIYPAAAVCPGGTCDGALSNLKQKTFYAAEYDAATKTFTTAKNFAFNGGFAFKGIVDGGKGAQYTAVTKAGVAPSFVPEKSQSAMIYGYIGDQPVLTAPASGHYMLLDNVASAAKVYGAIDYTSSANVSGCEKCHGAPYSKHGYRQAHVEGLPDFASCKACHTGQRVGSDADWQAIVDDPAGYAALPKDDKGAPILTDAMKAKYAYTANVMNDTHMSHAMEFNFPQSMANCVTCHEGKLDVILADSNFKISTCKSCHPVTGTGGTDSKRAPALKDIFAEKGVEGYHTWDLYTADPDCTLCHKAGGAGKTFKQIHAGRIASIYADDGSRFADAVATTVDSATFDAATSILTVKFSMTGLAANALVKPTIVVSLYGYGTKDFVVSGHASQFTDKTPNLEYTYGATVRNSNPPVSANTDRLTLAPDAPTAGTTEWTATADLTTWAGIIGAGKQVQRLEIAFLPTVGRDQTALVSATNPAIAVHGKTATVDLVGGTLVADEDAYGKNIVDVAKCNACHDALATTFHNPNYGSAGVVACRLCHFVGAGGSHIEMQSRSIDSYVHAIHSMQAMDLNSADYTDPIEELRHELHVEGNYPNFAGALNCESCHNTGTYEVPDQTKSLPSLLSASTNNLPRNINNVPMYVVGPASRACGSCHRAESIKEDDAATLAAFNQHTAMFGTLLGTTSTTGTADLDAVTQNIMEQLGGPTASVAAPTGTKVESCTVCHGNAGADHQAKFNRFADGL